MMGGCTLEGRNMWGGCEDGPKCRKTHVLLFLLGGVGARNGKKMDDAKSVSVFLYVYVCVYIKI